MHQKLLLDKISSVLAVTEQSNAAKLLKLIDEAGRIFVGGAGAIRTCFTLFCNASRA
jgi:6-phospho-3-hexuloisomerase